MCVERRLINRPVLMGCPCERCKPSPLQRFVSDIDQHDRRSVTRSQAARLFKLISAAPDVQMFRDER
jgi:hypothetical protein